MSKTAVLFPGLDALFLASKMKRWLANESAKRALSEASGYLAKVSGCDEDLGAFLVTESRPHLADFDRTLVALTALQIGIARAICEQSEWDIVVGCSHGDVARNVLTGVLSFEKAVEVLWIFAGLRKSCPEGATANVRTTDGTPLSAEHLTWLKEEGAPVSVWSDTNATVAGPTEMIQRLTDASRARGLKVKPVLAYPVHSPTMRPSTEIIRSVSAGWELGSPRWPVFSSVWSRFLEGAEDFREEGLASSLEPVRWVETLETLVSREGVRRFINVGPSNTLTGWLFSSQKFSEVELQDGWDLLERAGSAAFEGQSEGRLSQAPKGPATFQ